MDGVDAALIETDGEIISTFGPSSFVPYSPGFVDALRALQGPNPETAPHFAHLVGELTALHGDAVQKLLDENAISAEAVDVVGFHGQTVYHAPGDGITIQLGDGQALASRTGIRVVADFRSADVAAGGQGAPLVPLYHAALAHDLERPLAVLNIGGVANVTWLGGGGGDGDDILAFDTGPGNALIDDWVHQHTGASRDEGGQLAAGGWANGQALGVLLDDAFFQELPPKSLDRNRFDPGPVAGLSVEDGAATLTAFSAQAVARAVEFMPQAPRRWLVCGGGRHNGALMDALRGVLEVPVDPVEAVGWQGDELEAQAFAFLAVRALDGRPLSLPTTTGVGAPTSGGRIFDPA